MVRVKGKIIATATVDPIPGSAPRITPSIVPSTSTPIPSKVNIKSMACGSSSIMSDPQNHQVNGDVGNGKTSR